MGSFFSGLFGGGEKKDKVVVSPPKEDKAAEAQAAAKRKLARGFTQRDTIIGGMFDQGLKTKLGA